MDKRCYALLRPASGAEKSFFEVSINSDKRAGPGKVFVVPTIRLLNQSTADLPAEIVLVVSWSCSPLCLVSFPLLRTQRQKPRYIILLPSFTLVAMAQPE